MQHTRTIKIWTAIYFFIAFIEIYIGVWMEKPLVETIAKPLLMPALLLLYRFSIGKPDKWYVSALVFSFLGDVFLLDKSRMFLFGAGAFLMAQLIYIKIITDRLGKVSVRNAIISFIPFALYLTGLLFLLYEGLDRYRIPVIVYGTAISVFGMLSLLRYFERPGRKNLLMLIGALFFILSDSMIALHKFYHPESIYPVAIMMTYVVAQYLIYRSVIFERREKQIM